MQFRFSSFPAGAGAGMDGASPGIRAYIETSHNADITWAIAPPCKRRAIDKEPSNRRDS